jgi:TniQ protein
MRRFPPGVQLPVVLPPAFDELLSSWIGRHAAFYGVRPTDMLRYIFPEPPSLRALDLHLTEDQANGIAHVFRADPVAISNMTLGNIAATVSRMLAARAIQCCEKCLDGRKSNTIRRGQFFGWHLTCSLCGSFLSDGEHGEKPFWPFRHRLFSALDGERLIEDEAFGTCRAWASPSQIAQLLMMRRIPKALKGDTRLEWFRVLGVVIPEFDDIASEQTKMPSSARPVLSIQLRPALLAGVSIVTDRGPEMFEVLERHTVGENRTRFSAIVAAMMGYTKTPNVSLWQEI